MNQLYFNSKPIVVHKKFKDTFTFDEMSSILEKASVVVDKEIDEIIYSILISTKKYFFELNANSKDDFFIYCYDNEYNIESYLTKKEFIKILHDKDNPSENMDIIKIEN